MNSRYLKQELFIGKKGQKKIEESTIVVFGMGALGSAISEMLVRAGVGKLIIADRDYVEWSNLQRQQLYTEEDAKQKLPKAVAAKQRLQSINSQTIIKEYVMDIYFQNVEELAEGASILMDATDNFETRLVINDAAMKHNIPFVFGACVGSYGMTYPVLSGKGPCFHCLVDYIPSQNVTCDTEGVISPIVQWVASMQVAQAMQILSGEDVTSTLRSFDIWKMEHAEMNVEKLKNLDCPCCGIERLHPFLTMEKQTKADILCGRDAVHIRPPVPRTLDLKYLSKQWEQQTTNMLANTHLLSFQYEPYRVILFKDGRAIIHGTADITMAKNVYTRLTG